MNRFLRISSIYPDFLKVLKKKYDKKDESYTKTLNNIFDEMYSVSNFITQALSKKGYNCNEIIENADFIQKKWLDEFGDKSSNDTILIQQIKYYKPNVLFLGNANIAKKNLIETIRNFDFVKIILCFHCAPFTKKILNNLNFVDGIVTCTKGYSEKIYSITKKNVLLMRHAFPNNIDYNFTPQNRNIDISFIGSIFINTKLHNDRVDLVYKLMRNFKNSYIAINFSNKFLLQYIYYLLICILNLKILKNFNFFLKIIYIYFFSKKPSFGIDMLSILNKTKILINTHIKDTEYAGNMRLFEGTGSGCMLITDKKKDLDKLFIIGKEIEVFEHNSELIEKCKYYLNNYEKLKIIAEAGRTKTNNHHNYANSAFVLDKFIIKLLKNEKDL